MNPNKVEKLIEKYSDMVYRVALIHCSNHKEDAEDIFQEVFLALLRKKISFIDTEHEKAWLLRVTLNQCKKKYHNNQKNILLDETNLTYHLEQTDMHHHDELCFDLYHAICRLDQKYRTVIVLYYFEEFSTKKIAAILKLSDAAIRKRLSRGRELLRKFLEEDYHNEI